MRPGEEGPPGAGRLSASDVQRLQELVAAATLFREGADKIQEQKDSQCLYLSILVGLSELLEASAPVFPSAEEAARLQEALRGVADAPAAQAERFTPCPDYPSDQAYLRGRRYRVLTWGGWVCRDLGENRWEPVLSPAPADEFLMEPILHRGRRGPFAGEAYTVLHAPAPITVSYSTWGPGTTLADFLNKLFGY